MDTCYIEHPRKRSRRLVLAASVGIVLVIAAFALVAAQVWQPAQPVSFDPPTPTPPAAAYFDPTRATILSPDLDRSAALVWLSEDRSTLSLTYQHLQSNVETLGVWIMPPHENWTRIGTVPRTEQFEVFALTEPVLPDSRIAIVLEGNGSQPGLILLSASLR